MKKLLTTTIVFLSTAIPCFAMTPSELAIFATNYKYNEKAPVAYSYYNKACQTNVSISLVKTMDLGNGRIGGITNQFLCWGATYTYFEMARGTCNLFEPLWQYVQAEPLAIQTGAQLPIQGMI